VSLTGASQAKAYKILDELVGLEILKEITAGKREKVYRFDNYINCSVNRDLPNDKAILRTLKQIKKDSEAFLERKSLCHQIRNSQIKKPE
jgi:hypothetical protein